MAKHTNLIWSPSGCGKSSLFMGFSKGLFEETGKKTRLVSAEKAQSEGIFREGIEAGYVIPWWIDAKMGADGQMETPFERLVEAMLGDWPVDHLNPYSTLVKAFAIQYKAICKNVEKHDTKAEQLVYQSDKPAANATLLLCPKCKTPAVLETMRVVADKRLEEVGCYTFEGMTEFSELLMQNLQKRAAMGENTGGNIATRFQDGQMMIGSNTQGHYGTAQNQMRNHIRESRHLPVDYVWWSARMEDGKDDDRGGTTVFGPKISGTKKTPEIPAWFGTTLSACSVPVQNGTELVSEYRLYLREYYQSWLQIVAKVKCIVDNRIPPANLKGIPQFVKVDHDLPTLEVAGQKLPTETLLWHVTKLIEARQAPKKGPVVVQVAK